MGNTIAIKVVLEHVHDPTGQDGFYYVNVVHAATPVQTHLVGQHVESILEINYMSVLAMTIYQCPGPVFTPECARTIGVLHIPVQCVATGGIYHEWFCLQTMGYAYEEMDRHQVCKRFITSFKEVAEQLYTPKICITALPSIRIAQTCEIEEGRLRSLISSHKHMACYMNAMHAELRRLQQAKESERIARIAHKARRMAKKRKLSSSSGSPERTTPSVFDLAS